MSRFNLRRRPQICYYEPDLDEYIFCDPCGDYVYEYCSVHGPLLVIPDDKVPVSIPTHMPRATLTIPHVFLYLAPSSIPGAGIGVFASLTLPRGVRFGPYGGKYTNEIKSKYCWQIYNQNNRPSHVVDAADENDSNWMRYVNCSRHWLEQNLVAFQYRGQLYYRTIKIIPRYTELLVFYGAEFASALQIDLKHYNSPVKFARKDAQTTGQEEHGKIEHIASSVETVILANNFPQDLNVLENSHDITKNNDVPSKNTTQEVQAAKSPLKFDSKNNKIKKTNVICNECNEHFDSKSSLIQHLQTHSQKLEKYFSCNICNFNNSDVDVFVKHLRDQHGATSQISDLQQKISQETPTYPGNQPRTLYPLKFENQNLMDIRSNCFDKSHPDSLFAQIFLQTKTDIHTDKKKRQCSICKKILSSNYKLNQHLMLHTDQKNFSCSMCNKSYHTNSSLKKHTKRHTIENHFTCNICGETFSEKYTLNAHLSCHNQNEFPCPVCQKVFTSARNLRKHLKRHSNNKTFTCAICANKFRDKCSLKRHIMLIHNSKKDFLCSMCHKRFISDYYLKRHLKIHSDNKPFSCTVCKKSFIRNSHLKHHMTSHNQYKNFSCSICNKMFAYGSSLKRHLKTHNISDVS
ncbi:zinc finger protein 883-like [Pectinophora gossypiella]|uniref:zinc finger protein 883-like n=1 Tax=Pectinophora gossypiella TaxID=13191 RepID=UPI00214E6435|nr:zinc finger protein 883-like [Pectinophora gossypiella]